MNILRDYITEANRMNDISKTDKMAENMAIAVIALVEIEADNKGTYESLKGIAREALEKLKQ